jgi:phosphoglucosamine mutase
VANVDLKPTLAHALGRAAAHLLAAGDGPIVLGQDTRRSGAGLGGEKSGHVIVMERTTSGDGIVTAIEVLGIVARRERPLSELAEEIPLFPQQQRAVWVRHKDRWNADPAFAGAIADAKTRLEGTGRIVVRPSGTEAMLRIMVEGEDAGQVTSLADALTAVAAERLH